MALNLSTTDILIGLLGPVLNSIIWFYVGISCGGSVNKRIKKIQLAHVKMEYDIQKCENLLLQIIQDQKQ